MALYRETDFNERRNAAMDAKKALLERFKQKPDANDPAVIARRQEREAIIKAREERAKVKEKERKEREAREAVARAERERIEAEARAAAGFLASFFGLRVSLVLRI